MNNFFKERFKILLIIKYHMFSNADSDIPNKSLKYNLTKETR